jgi:hypothetical protein
LISILVGILFVATAGTADAEKLGLEQLKEVGHKYRFALDYVSADGKDHRFIYANNRNRLFVYKVSDEGITVDWEVGNLGSRVTALTVTDVRGDGRMSIVIATSRGRILAYGLEEYDLEYENINDKFGLISTMAVANIDDDVQQELIILGGNRLYIFDVVSNAVEWRSNQTYAASQMVIGNTDDDPQVEIVLNTGWVIDSRFYNNDLEINAPFGDRIMLIDMNGDGYNDVFGEFNDFGLRVYDVYAQREMW